MTLVLFLASNRFLTEAFLRENPLLTPLGILFVVDWKTPPWQALSVVSAGLTVGAVFLLDWINIEYEEGVKQSDAGLVAAAERKLRFVVWLTRLRFVLVVVFQLVVGGQALLYFNSRSYWFPVPASVTMRAAWLYGDRMPEPQCHEAR